MEPTQTTDISENGVVIGVKSLVASDQLLMKRIASAAREIADEMGVVLKSVEINFLDSESHDTFAICVRDQVPGVQDIADIEVEYIYKSKNHV